MLNLHWINWPLGGAVHWKTALTRLFSSAVEFFYGWNFFFSESKFTFLGWQFIWDERPGVPRLPALLLKHKWTFSLSSSRDLAANVPLRFSFVKLSGVKDDSRAELKHPIQPRPGLVCLSSSFSAISWLSEVFSDCKSAVFEQTGTFA